MRVSRLLALCVLLVLPGAASSVDYSPPHELIAQADFIVRAKVIGQQAVERGPAIYTRHTLLVLEPLKGSPPDELEVMVPGGVSRGLRHVVLGVPQLKVGDEYLLFLRLRSGGTLEILGSGQGVFQIQADAGGEPVLSQAGSPGLIREARSGQLRVYQPLRLRLGELKQMIRSTRAPSPEGVTK